MVVLSPGYANLDKWPDMSGNPLAFPPLLVCYSCQLRPAWFLAQYCWYLEMV